MGWTLNVSQRDKFNKNYFDPKTKHSLNIKNNNYNYNIINKLYNKVLNNLNDMSNRTAIKPLYKLSISLEWSLSLLLINKLVLNFEAYYFNKVENKDIYKAMENGRFYDLIKVTVFEFQMILEKKMLFLKIYSTKVCVSFRFSKCHSILI